MAVLNNAFGLLLAPEAGGGGGGTIERSVRFNSADSAYFSRTPASAGNSKTWTWAGWVKRADLGTLQHIFEAYTSTDIETFFRFDSDGGLKFGTYNAGYVFELETANLFRDPSAWYHFVVVLDTPQATASDRAKIYVNGNLVTDFDISTYPSQNSDHYINDPSYIHYIGRNGFASRYLGAYLADIHFIDGQALTPTSFGEFDATTGVWNPIAYTGSYGTNGFHLPFSNNSTAAALGTDTSGNGNDWTVNNISTFTNKTLPTVIFDGVGDYLSLASSADFAMSTGDFTAEAYIYYSRDFSYAEGGYSPRVFDSNTGQLGIYVTADGTGYIGAFVGGTDIRSSTAPSLKTWNHVAICRSGTTFRIFLNGTVIHSVTNSSSVASAADFNIGARTSGEGGFPGAISNLRLIKGTALYTTNFTPPSSPLSNVTNTKLLCCQSSSSATAATVSPGTITGNGNVSANTLTDSQVDEDSLRDAPVNGSQTDTGVGGEVVGNYCTWNPLDNVGNTISNGNLDSLSTAAGISKATIAVSSGKWYWEVTKNAGNTSIGIAEATALASSQYLGVNSQTWSYYSVNGYIYTNGSGSAYGASYGVGDVIGVALDLDNDTLTFYKNGVSQGTAATGLTDTYVPAVGNDQSGPSVSANFGQRPFAYTAPSGFKALCTANLPTPTIADGSTVMDVETYAGNSSTQTISGLGFGPDLVWIKRRDGTGNHSLYDSVRGATNFLISSSTAQEGTDANSLTSFNADGFSLSSPVTTAPNLNTSGQNYVAWTWDAGSSTASNTDGDIASNVRANPTAGFSIVTYTGNGTGGATVGHGLGATCQFIVVKRRDSAQPWLVLHTSVGLTGDTTFGLPEYYMLHLNQTSARQNYSQDLIFPGNSATFALGSGGTGYSNANGGNYVAYCFAPVAGYSAFGSYTGNGSADGPFVYTGFKPAFVLIKCSSSDQSGNAWWLMYDNKRLGYNPDNVHFGAQSSDAEFNASSIDLTSNGFKLRDTNTSRNASSATYIYAAFAESPYAYSRAR